EDFLAQMQQMKKLGPLEGILKMLPGAGQMGLDKVNIDPKQMAHIEAIIYSMTPEERKNPALLNHKRKIRISKGCGRGVPEINRLLKQFEQSKKMMKQMSTMMGGQAASGKKGKKGKKGQKGLPNMGQMPNMPTGGFPGMGGFPSLGGKGGFPGKGGKGGFPF
ncbi:MAG: signal recognition particle protein, partial [Culicoidibacterales bacterium]